MFGRPPLSRRRRLIVQYTLLGLAVTLLASVLLFALRRSPEPYAAGERVEGITSELERGLPDGYPRLQFSDDAAAAGLAFRHFHGVRSSQLPEDMGSGAAWGDYDNDGDLDLYLCDIAAPLTATEEELSASPGGNRLFRNNGDATFTDVTSQAGVGFKGIGMAAAWADFDNDGFLDLAVTSYRSILLYRNRGDGTFQDVSRKAGLDRFRGFWAGASWGDYNRDGKIDLYICGYVRYSYQPELAAKATRQFQLLVPFTLNPSSYTPERNLLFRNQGNGVFTEVAKQAGVDNPTGRSLAAAWADLDGDGWPDLYVANDVSDNALYRNLGNGRFEDISHPAWAADYRGAMGLAVGDWDRDGDLDIFVTHWLAQENAMLWNMRFNRGTASSGPLRFTDVADMLGLGQISLNAVGWGTSFFDYDNDGRADLFAANGSTLQTEKDPTALVPQKNFLFWQKSPEEGFFDTGRVSGAVFQTPRVARGAAFADYDNDGSVDIVVVNHGGPVTLLRNQGRLGNWIKVRVKCVKSNRAGIGSLVEVETQGFRQIDEIGSQPSYLSQNALEAHFGLGKAAQVDRLAVRFPSGTVRELRNLPANQTVTVQE